MITFDTLVFETKHVFGKTKIQSKLKLDNNIIISVIGGFGCYGDGIDTFEMAAWYDNDENGFIKLGEYDDVLGWLSKEQITNKITELSKL